MSEKKSKQADFRDMTELDAVTMVVNTAVVAANSGHQVLVANVDKPGHVGIVIWLPGYVHDGSSIVVANGNGQ